MNRERAKELLPIIQAFAEGKDVQWKGSGAWFTSEPNDMLEFSDHYEYRIKPEPFECWTLGFSDKSFHERTYETEKEAEDSLCVATGRVIHMREVE